MAIQIQIQIWRYMQYGDTDTNTEGLVIHIQRYMQYEDTVTDTERYGIQIQGKKKHAI